MSSVFDEEIHYLKLWNILTLNIEILCYVYKSRDSDKKLENKKSWIVLYFYNCLLLTMCVRLKFILEALNVLFSYFGEREKRQGEGWALKDKLLFNETV